MEAKTWENFKIYLFTVKKLDKSNECSYRSIFLKTCEWFKDHEFNQANLYLFFDYLQNDRKLANQTLNNYLKTLKHYCTFQKLDYLKEFSYFSKNQKEIEYLTESELVDLVRYGYARSYRSGVVIETLARCALRNGELCRLEWSDYRGDHFILRDTKSGKTQKVIILPDLARKIERLTRVNKYVFGSYRGPLNKEYVNEFIREAGKRAGITKHLHAHLLRHTAATLAVKNNENIFKIQKFLRHASPESTLNYVHLDISDTQEIAESNPLSQGSITIRSVQNKVQKFYDTLKFIPYKKDIIIQDRKVVLTIKF